MLNEFDDSRFKFLLAFTATRLAQGALALRGERFSAPSVLSPRPRSVCQETNPETGNKLDTQMLKE